LHYPHFYTQDIDIILQEYTIEEYLFNSGWTTSWIDEENKFAILSPLYPQSNNFLRMLLNTFPIDIWIFLIIAIVSVGLIMEVKNKMQCIFIIALKNILINSQPFYSKLIVKIKRKERYKIDFVKVIMNISASLLNQGIKIKNDIVINIWCLMSLVLVACFSSHILSSLIFQPFKTINNFEELVQSNLSVITGNWSYLYHAHNWAGKDKKLIFLHEKIMSLYDWDICLISHYN